MLIFAPGLSKVRIRRFRANELSEITPLTIPALRSFTLSASKGSAGERPVQKEKPFEPFELIELIEPFEHIEPAEALPRAAP